MRFRPFLIALHVEMLHNIFNIRGFISQFMCIYAIYLIFRCSYTPDIFHTILIHVDKYSRKDVSFSIHRSHWFRNFRRMDTDFIVQVLNVHFLRCAPG